MGLFKERRQLREMNEVRIGVVGLVVTTLLVIVALNVSAIGTLLTSSSYHANFSESGGVKGGDDVRVAGRNVGKVKDVKLMGTYVSVSFSATDITLGDTSSAAVKSDNALGRKFLSISPGGTGRTTTIAKSRTNPGYSVNTALGNLTANNAKLNTTQLADSFESLTAILNETPEAFRGALAGVSAFSKSISSRDAALDDLLKSASGLSGVLSKRNAQITSIMGDGSEFLGELQTRRQVLEALLTSIQNAANELEGLVADNKTSLKPALTQLDGAASLLTKYRGDLDFVLKNFGGFIRSLGEAVGSGPFFQAYLQNLTSPSNLAPVISDAIRGSLVPK